MSDASLDNVRPGECIYCGGHEGHDPCPARSDRTHCHMRHVQLEDARAFITCADEATVERGDEPYYVQLNDPLHNSLGAWDFDLAQATVQRWNAHQDLTRCVEECKEALRDVRANKDHTNAWEGHHQAALDTCERLLPDECCLLCGVAVGVMHRADIPHGPLLCGPCASEIDEHGHDRRCLAKLGQPSSVSEPFPAYIYGPLRYVIEVEQDRDGWSYRVMLGNDEPIYEHVFQAEQALCAFIGA